MSDELEGAGTESVDSSISTDTSIETASNPAIEGQPNAQDAPAKEEFQFDDEILAETEKIVAEAQAEADKVQKPLESYLRKVISSKQMEVNALKAKTPEYGESEKFAIELHEGLTAFDNETGRPTAKEFARKLVAKDADLATEASWDLLNQQIDASGLTIGHKLLQRMGLDPHKLNELRQFSKGEIKGADYGIVEIPPGVPREYADAYKALSPILREDVEFNLDNEDPQRKAAALEHLRDKQDKINYDRYKAEQEQHTTQTLQNEINTQTERDEAETFTTFVEGFKETPTYTKATVSGNPQFDSFAKSAVNMMILGLGYPDSVFGQQSAKFFADIGVTVNQAELSSVVDQISGNIQAAVKAEKGKFTSAAADAISRKQTAIERASGMRNRLFGEAITKVAGLLKQVSEGNGAILDANGGIPVLNGNAPQAGGQPKLSTLEIIKSMAAK